MHDDLISSYANDRLGAVAPGLIGSGADALPAFSVTAVTVPTGIWVSAAGTTYTNAAG
ncbi:hypothetical protein [Amycolatopsis minnesotensis]|uniref:Uncharacterized protein n=1 Tax=Amycolatopsis minnesotensis TaxID=337894 RepID=A0ABP5DWB6_9PSEU